MTVPFITETDLTTADRDTLVEWCRGLLIDREEAICWANMSRRESESFNARARAVADLCDVNPGADWASLVRAALRGEAP